MTCIICTLHMTVIMLPTSHTVLFCNDQCSACMQAVPVSKLACIQAVPVPTLCDADSVMRPLSACDRLYNAKESGLLEYSTSKIYELMFAREVNKRLKVRCLSANCLIVALLPHHQTYLIPLAPRNAESKL